MSTIVCIAFSVLSFFIAIYLFEKMMDGCPDEIILRLIGSIFLGGIWGGVIGWVANAPKSSIIGGIIGTGQNIVTYQIVALLLPILLFVCYFLWLFSAMNDRDDISTNIGAIEWHYNICRMFPTNVRIVGFKRIVSGSEVVIPWRIFGKNVTEIGEKTFMGQDGIKSVEFEFSYLQTICEKAFYGCSNLLAITIPSTVRYIENEAFMNCSKLKEIDWNVSDYHDCRIGSQAFAGCLSLEKFTVPNDCEVEDGAFENCTNLKSISIPQSLEGKSENWGLPKDCNIFVRLKKQCITDDGIFIPMEDTEKGQEQQLSCSTEIEEAYKLLGVSMTDSRITIQKAYLANLSKVSEILPLNQTLAEKMMAEINTAWKTIEENSLKK